MTRDESTRNHSLRADPHVARARAVIQTGEVGAPRTLRLGWSFPPGTDPIEAVTALADAALWLLDAEPASLYALAGADDGPPLLHVNVLAANGALALLEVALDAEGFPARRELHLLGSEGEIVHRTGQDDLLWSADGAEALHAAGAPARQADDDEAARRNLTIARALATSLTRREPIVVTEGSAR
jgi:predicted dehydrogenase